MSKSEVFKMAHQMAKQMEGDYRARFGLALKILSAYNKEKAKRNEIEKIQSAIRALYNGTVSENLIRLNTNTYVVKEELKKLNFKFTAQKTWVFTSEDYNETLEIAKKVIALY